MNILLVTDAYPPEIRSASHLMQELAEELQHRGHSISILTCYPRYNLAEEVLEKQYPESVYENGIHVIRVRTPPHHKVSFVIRGLSQLLLPAMLLLKLKRHIRNRLDCVLVYSPPLPLYVIGSYLKSRMGALYLLNVQDLFPQNAIDLGILKNRMLIGVFEWLEQRAYKSASVVTVHSESNRRFLIERERIARRKIEVLHNWVDMDMSKEREPHSSFRSRFELEGKFVFFFGGVIGPAQGLDLLVRCAARLRHEEDIAVLIVGDGSAKESLSRTARNYEIRNVLFESFVSKQEYSALLSEIDVGVVCLSPKNRTPVVPGKILGYMAASVPILAFLNRESDGHEIIRKANCGLTAVSDDEETAVNLMLKMYSDRKSMQRLGRRGYEYALQHFSKEVCMDHLEEILVRQ